MKVFKFGGAALRDSENIKNACRIIKMHQGSKLLVVVSAMGKTTNAIERVINTRLDNKDYTTEFLTLKNDHFKILHELFDKDDDIFSGIEELFNELEKNLSFEISYDQLYDQTVSHGELISSTIVNAHLKKINASSKWLDAREYIITNDHFREGLVDWDKTKTNIGTKIPALLDKHVIVTQGFIGGTETGYTTTLGREGSDFSGAIFASCLGAESLTVWKDVPGILNADPKVDPKAKMFNELPYNEAAEMTFYGASVIHPKTIKPLANTNIPLLVKSFIHHEDEGTVIHDCQIDEILPTFIIKNNQCLVSFKVIDYSFINEENLSLIFKKVSEADLKINIMQNSAISFSVSIDYDREKLDALLDSLQDQFDIRYNTGLQLITIKNYSRKIVERYREDKQILLEQISRNNYRALISL